MYASHSEIVFVLTKDLYTSTFSLFRWRKVINFALLVYYNLALVGVGGMLG